MFVEEALWVRGAIERLRLPSGATVADVGSGDLFGRTRVQPHIHHNIYTPLLEKHISITSCDAKKELGVDVALDVCSHEVTPFAIIGKRFDLVLCANMLEHVVDRDRALANVLTLVKQNGFLLLTVPHTYFYHEDPIDTMYRPTPDELRSLVRKYISTSVIEERLLSITERQYYVMPVYPNVLVHNIPFFGYRNLWRWVLKPFRWKVSCVLYQVLSENSSAGGR